MTTLDRRGLLQATAAAMIAAPTLVRSQPAPAGQHPVARTRHGPVRGFTDKGVLVFKGVRYGADTATTRFRPPRAPQAWTEVRDAFEYGPSAPQRGREEARISEDCLFLNVWTPALDRGRRPVMFYIHGGGYSGGSGSSPLYDGVNLVNRGDVVVVTVNHRLNAFGYLYLSRLGDRSFASAANAGQADLILALQWVRDNISAFGGDPNKVMVFGQSGGGAKIATMMAQPAAAGLFHRVATMSGQQVTAAGPKLATQRALEYLDALDLKTDQLSELDRLPLDRLVAAQAKAVGGSSPVYDGRSLPRHPFYPDAPSQSAHIPMIIGNTHDETRSLIGGGDPSTFSLTWEELPDRLDKAITVVDTAAEDVIAEYRRLYPQYSPSDVFFAATTAGRSWRAAVVEAEERAKAGTPAYVYQLDWGSPKDGGKWGAPHTIDIPLVFDNCDKEGSITGTAPDALKMAEVMSEAFIAHAKTGSPNHKSLPRWTPYTLPRRQTMVLNRTSRMVDDPRGAERALFGKAPYNQPV
jgi:para-nitrobenzyl esterase